MTRSRRRARTVALASLTALAMAAGCGGGSGSGNTPPCLDCVKPPGSNDLAVMLAPGELKEGGAPVTATLKLKRAPKEDVIITLTTTDMTEGTVEPAQLTFTAMDWSAPQTITLTPVDDREDDGDQEWRVEMAVSSADITFNSRPVNPLVLKTIDDDEAATLKIETPDGETLSEAGDTVRLKLTLSAKPDSTVVFPVKVMATVDGEAEVDVEDITFTPETWNVPQSITLRAPDDMVADGDQPVQVVFGPSTSDDPVFANINVSAMFTAVDGVCGNGVLDGAEVCDAALAPGCCDDTCAPKGTVCNGVGGVCSSNNQCSTGTCDATFTDGGYCTATCSDDDDCERGAHCDVNTNRCVKTCAAASECGRMALGCIELAGTGRRGCVPGPQVLVNPPGSLRITEAGETATFSIRLSMPPTGMVTLPVKLSSGQSGEAVASPSSLQFNAQNWQTPQQVTISAPDDQRADGDQQVTVTFGPPMSSGIFSMAAPVAFTLTSVDGICGNGITDGSEQCDSAADARCCDSQCRIKPGVCAPTGASCNDGDDCVGQECLDSDLTEGGYCTATCSSDAQCGPGAHCSGMCLETCNTDNDCRRSGYSCVDIDGDGKRECLSTGSVWNDIGSPCQDSSECKDFDTACYAHPHGNLCSKDCSTGASCPSGSVCSPDRGLCLVTCNSSCRPGYSCQVHSGQSVCMPVGAKSAPQGGACTHSVLCAEGGCITDTNSGQGYCSKGCNAGECASGMHCGQFQTADGGIGQLCFKTCTSNTQCPTGFTCSESAGPATSGGTNHKECVPTS